MVHFERVIPSIQEVYLELRDCDKKDVNPTKEQLQGWADKMKEVAKAEHERLFIIMAAQIKGWTFARELDFCKSG